MKIEIDEDFGNMMVSAIRYGLWRRTYITRVTSDYIVPLVKRGAFSQRVLSVMDNDLTRYETERANPGRDRWTLDDDCDFAAWTSLHRVVKEQLEKKNGHGRDKENHQRGF